MIPLPDDPIEELEGPKIKEEEEEEKPHIGDKPDKTRHRYMSATANNLNPKCPKIHKSLEIKLPELS